MVDRLVEDKNNNINPGRRPQVSIDLQIGNHLRTAHPSPISADQVVLVPSLFGSDLSATTFHELREELVPLLRVKYRHRSDQNKSRRNNGSHCNRSNKEEDEEEDEGTASGWLLDLARMEGGGILVAPRSLGSAALARIIIGGPKESAAPSRTITTTGGKRSVGDADAAADVIDAVLFKNDDDDDDEDEDDEEEGVFCAKENAHAANPRPGVPSSSSSSSLHCRAVAEVVRRLCKYYSIDPQTALVNVGIFVGRPRANHVKARPAQSYVSVRRFCPCLVCDVVRSHLSHLHARAQTQQQHHKTYRPKFYNSCFVVAAFGSARTIVLEHPSTDATVKVPLANNSAVAMLRDVTAHGWLYKIVEGDRSRLSSRGGSGSGGSPPEETITVLISGRCSAVRHGPATVAMRPSAPCHHQHPHHRQKEQQHRPKMNAGVIYPDGAGFRRRVSVGPDGADPSLAVVSEELSFSSRASPEEDDFSYYGPHHRRQQVSSRSPEVDRYGGGLDPGHHRHSDPTCPPPRSREAAPASCNFHEGPSRGLEQHRSAHSCWDDGITRSRHESEAHYDHHHHHQHHGSRSRSRSRSPSHPHRGGQRH
jgi:hypothetical protein